jgi:hypothetical protein
VTQHALPDAVLQNTRLTMPEMEMMHGKEPEMDEKMKMMWEKLDDKTRKMMMLRMMDEKIMMKEGWIRHLQHKVETLKLLKAAMEKM